MEDKKPLAPHIAGEGSAHSEFQIRLQKLASLQEAHINPWPEYREVDATCQKALDDFNADRSTDKKYALAGRILSLREHGKTIFATIQDRSGKLQLYFKRDHLGEGVFSQLKSFFDVGDIIWCEGTLFRTKMGEVTLQVDSLQLLSKCLHPLPEKYHGLSDVEVRYRQRYLDLISNPESLEKFKRRSHIIQAVRTFLIEHEFVEVETPMLHPLAGGAAARPFITHHNTYDMDLYLRIAPELYLKRLVVGGLERVFEINRNFRNEGVSTKHNPEFTMLEFYMAHGDYKKGIELTEQLLRFVIAHNFSQSTLPFKEAIIDYSKPFRRLNVYDSLLSVGGFSSAHLEQGSIDKTLQGEQIVLPHKNPSYGEKLWALFEECVESKLIEPTFIIGHPVEVSPLAKRDPANPLLVARFELFVGGMELANGFTELNDPFDQAERFRMQLASGHDEAHQFDEDYIRALEFGLPPTVGVGIGIDRLVMLLTNTPSIKDVILFPTMKPKAKEKATTHEEVGSETGGRLFKISPSVIKQFPHLAIGVVVARNIDNTHVNVKLQALLEAKQKEICAAFTKPEEIALHPKIEVWREAYRSFGSKPSEYRSSVENLFRMILKGKGLRSASPLVDIYNYISLQYMVPAGGEDLDKIQGSILLSHAHENEPPLVLLGDTKPEKPYVGEIIYKDAISAICRRWNWREADRTKLTSETKNAFFVLEALPPVSRAEIEQATFHLAEMLGHYCGAKTQAIILDSAHPSLELDDAQ